jgi:23S rRNA pseudouridine1911/1915/1917 synthase
VPKAEPILVAEHADFLVVAKPPDLLSHPTRPDGKATLLGWLQERFPGQFVALVNRLDRETSGAVLIARSAEAASRMGAMTMRREIHKEYLALVSGRVETEHATIDAPIGRLGLSPENSIWLRQGVIPADDPRKSATACTEYWRVAASDLASLLRIETQTGRLHQIRVHLAYAGHPVIGDKIYGPDPLLYLKFIDEGWTEQHQRVLGLPRHALHAHRLHFRWNDEERTFTVPMPEDIRAMGEKSGLSMDSL